MTVPKCIIDMLETRTIIRTIEAQIVQKLENNEARPKFTGSYKKKRVLEETNHHHVFNDIVYMHELCSGFLFFCTEKHVLSCALNACVFLYLILFCGLAF